VTEVEAVEEVAPVHRRRPAWIAALIALLLVIGAGTWWFSSARLVEPGDGSFGIGIPVQGELVTWTFGSMMLCTEGVDSVLVESVEVESGDLRVTDFAVRPQPEPGEDGIILGFGSEPRPLSSTDFRGDLTVRGRCADEDYTELAVELTRRESATAAAKGLLVSWSAGLRSGTLRIPGQFVFCAAAVIDAPECDSDPIL
jgi:hypothetical protein